MLSLAVLLLAGCSADSPFQRVDGLVLINMTAQVSEVDVTRAGTAVQNTQFASGETFYVHFPSNVTVSNTKYTTTDASGTTKVATGSTQPYFNAGASSAAVHAYYPSTHNETTSSFTVQKAQNTDANYRASDLMYATIASLSKSSASVTGNLTFTHKMAKVMVTANIGTGVTDIRAIRIIGGNRTINISTPLNCVLGTTLSNANSTSDYITMWSGTTTSLVNCAALIPPQNISGDFLQIVTNAGTVTYSLASAKSFASAKSYQLTITVNAAAVGTTVSISGWTGTGNVTVNPTVEAALPDRTPPGVTAVDLGLYVGGASSGKKLYWANMNVGATSVTDYGLYFAWGDVIGRSGTISSGTTAADGYSFSWKNTPYNYGSSSFAATKYNNTDGKTTLEKCDDAAYMNWGGKWRMPTWKEMNKLMALSNSWTTDYNGSGIAGRVFTGSNDNTIFLPATGRRNDVSVRSQGSEGNYWSSTVEEGDEKDAYALGCSVGQVRWYDYYRYFAVSVRPVREEE